MEQSTLAARVESKTPKIEAGIAPRGAVASKFLNLRRIYGDQVDCVLVTLGEFHKHEVRGDYRATFRGNFLAEQFPQLAGVTYNLKIEYCEVDSDLNRRAARLLARETQLLASVRA